MRCVDVAVNLPDFLLDRLEPNLKKAIENHLVSCPRCSAELEEFREPVRILGSAGIEEYPDAFWQQLHYSIMESVSRNPAKSKWRVPAFAGAIAVLLLMAGIGIFEMSRKPEPGPKSITALASSLTPEQVVALPAMNVNYVDEVSSQASELDEMDAVDDSVQQAVVNALWSSIGDTTGSLESVYFGASLSN